MTGDKVVSARVTIRNRRGLHARASAKFVQVAERFKSRITVEHEGVRASGTSIMGLMMLAAAPGAEILIEVEGADAEAALFALLALVDGKFGEDATPNPM